MSIYTFLEKLPNEGDVILIIDKSKNLCIEKQYIPKFFDGIVNLEGSDWVYTTTEELGSDYFYPLNTLWYPIPQLN